MKWSPLKATFHVADDLPTQTKTLFHHGRTVEALKVLDLMHLHCLYPACDETYVFLLHQCTERKSLSEGRLFHDHISKHNFKVSSTLKYTILSMYAKCGSLVETRAAFDQIEQHDVVGWTFMINECVKQGAAHEAFVLYHRMIQEGTSPNNVTYLCVLKACSCLQILRHGTHIHVHILLSSFALDAKLGNSLVDMYAKCGTMEGAHLEFDLLCERSLVSWNSLIAGYVKHSKFERAFFLLIHMVHGGVQPDAVTYLSILKACGISKDFFNGKLIHSNLLRLGLEATAYLGVALVDMYCKCESLEDARCVFQRMAQPRVEAWNALIGGYAELGEAEKSFELFGAMKLAKLEPGKVTFLGILKASAVLATFDLGSVIHSLIKRAGLESDLFIASNLVDMHSKCGNLKEAQILFNKMASKSVVTWNTLITGYALHGQAEEAFELSRRMERDGVSLNHVTFVGLLFACSHIGLVEEGCNCFDILSEGYGLEPLMEHYGCMVDIFGRAGQLKEAVYMIKRMPFEPSSVVWKALLGACRLSSDLALAKCIVMGLEQQDKEAFVLLSNIYAAGESWEDLDFDWEV